MLSTNILETIAQEIGQQMKISFTFARSFKKQLQQLFQKKPLKLKGPKWKASPTVLQLLKICKAKYQLWVENGKQNDKYKVENIMAK